MMFNLVRVRCQTDQARMHAGTYGKYALLTSGQFLCQTITPLQSHSIFYKPKYLYKL